MRKCFAVAALVLQFIAVPAVIAAPPPYPVLFVHGLTGSADRTWADALSHFESQPGWGPAAIVAPSDVSTTPGHLYALNFSDSDQAFPSQNLTFSEQGGELATVIATILSANPGAARVMLVAHSMGGVASRNYLEGLGKIGGQAVAYNDDVAGLITIGTPHMGTPVANTCRDLVFLCGPFLDFFDPPLDPDSRAMKSLQTDSSEIKALNSAASVTELPIVVVYRSVIGGGQSVPVVLETDSDRVVPTSSQDLAAVPGTGALDHSSVTLDYSALNAIGGIGHLEEGDDPRFFAEVNRLVDDLSVCGNGTAEGSETCDDANTEGADGCSAACLTEACGDPISDAVVGFRSASMPPVGNAVTASDALYVLQSAVGTASCALCVCDVNADQNIAASDALAILVSAVGGAVSLACPAC